VLDFLKKLFLPPERSSETAKERLRVVLLSDHLSLAPETVEALKRDLLEVISKYVEIDLAHADVSFEQRERDVAMLANVPITGIREYPRPTAPRNVEPSPAPQPAAHALESTESSADTEAAPVDEAESALAPASDIEERQPPPTRASHAAAPRRRRRKKSVAIQPS